MPCKKIGFHEKFLGIVPFGCLEPCKPIFVPRNFLQCSQELVQKFPGTVSWEYFFHVSRWPYSSRTVDGTGLSKKYELEIMNEYGV